VPGSAYDNPVSFRNYIVNGNAHIRETGTNRDEVIFHALWTGRLPGSGMIEEIVGEDFVYDCQVPTMYGLLKELE